MDYPIREPMIHHPREIGQLHAVPVQVYSPGRAVKREVKDPIIAFAKQIEVVLKLLPGVAGEVAEFRLHGLRDQL